MSRIPVGILGATGLVGQHLVALLQKHPWFEIKAVAASERSLNKRYGDFWRLEDPLLDSVANMTLKSCKPGLPCTIIFSSLPAKFAGSIESTFADAGYKVISNSRSHRMDENVPLVVPEVNPAQMELMKLQPYEKGCIITNPNCVVVGLAIILKPLVEAFGVKSVAVTTLQAISGAGFLGIDPEMIQNNVIPYIVDEEEKIETELIKILGPMIISAQCVRVPVSNGHTVCVTVELKTSTTKEAILSAWENFEGLDLPLAPKNPIKILDAAPEPKKHLKAMEVVVGRLRECPRGGWKFVFLSDNQIRGAAGSAVLNAELLTQKFSYLNDEKNFDLVLK